MIKPGQLFMNPRTWNISYNYLYMLIIFVNKRKNYGIGYWKEHETVSGRDYNQDTLEEMELYTDFFEE